MKSWEAKISRVKYFHKSTINNDLSEPLLNDSQNKWDAFIAASRTADIPLPDDPPFLSTLKRVFAFSDFVASGVTRNPKLLQDLYESKDLLKTYKGDDYPGRLRAALTGPSTPKNRAELCRTLRRFRFREMIRIAWRDLAARSDLAETMSDLSALADTCIDLSLAILHDWQCVESGTPLGADGGQQHMAVFGMGKLGGRELNFSSDVDLIFVFPHAGETQGGPKPVSIQEFFTHLSRRLIEVIGAKTPDGLVFRVDMRLRPFGESGPIVMSFDAMEDYYQNQGREWERYAWIKARAVAGDKEAGARLLQRLKPFVFRKYLDFGAFEALRDMKQKIAFEVKKKGMKDNIKLGAGGIREVEFFGQTFQLIRGGVTPALQEPRIQKTLPIVARMEYITQDICDELLEAYKFLRNTEHRLQEFSDRQTHDLPSDPVERERLAASMEFSDWPSFDSRLRHHMKNVHHHFNNLLGARESAGSHDQEKRNLHELRGLWEAKEKYEGANQALSSAGFDEPDRVITILENLRKDPATRALSSEGRMRLDRLIPTVLREAGSSGHSYLVLNRIIDLIKAVERRTNYLALLFENPTALVHLVRLADASPWIVSFLARHPVLLDELLDPRTLYSPPEKSDIEGEIRRKLDQISPDDLESQIIELCIFRQVNTLRVAAADITGALPLMRVSDYLTGIAETVLDQVLEISWNHLVKQHGTPTSSLTGKECSRGFSIIAYGKLGGIELGYGSDLDLVFLHAGAEGKTDGGPYPTDNAHFFSRLGQRIIHTLTSSTPAGVLYETDMRLRPDGSSGILAVNIESFKDYQEKRAWTWEHQALIKARAISGDPQLNTYFEKIRRDILALPRETSRLKKEVKNMRKRMREELQRPEPDLFDIKQGTGGLIDIEFIVQYLVLLNAHIHVQLTKWTDVVRLLQTLSETGIIDDRTNSFLKEAYLTYRAAIHRLTLQQRPLKQPMGSFGALPEEVSMIWENLVSSQRVGPEGTPS